MKSSMIAGLTAFVTAAMAAPAPAAPGTSPAVKGRDMDLNAFLGAIEAAFPGIHASIEGVCGLITDGENTLANGFDITMTDNTSGCSDVTLVFARGTCDPGNVGALVGPPFIDALQDALGSQSLGVQGVDYPASVEGYLSDDPTGGQTMASEVQSILSSCPNTKLVMGGYSQGGYVVHNAASDLGDTMSQVSAVVIFGDPQSDQAVDGIDPSKVKIYCHDGDDICQAGEIILIQHLTYADDASDAASFVVSQL